MKSADYGQVRNDHLILSMDVFFPESEDVFQDGNARIHRAKTVKDWFQEQKSSFVYLHWQP